jgi:hypothetical protein
MPEQGSNLGKGHLLKATDTLLMDTSKYPARLADLNGANPALVSLAQAQNIVSTPADQVHAEKEWLGGPGEPKAWWPTIPEKEEILRQGFICAYERALATTPAKVIKTYWLYGFNDFEVVVDDCGPQVNLFIQTPAPPPKQVIGTYDEDLYVVGSDARIGKILDNYSNRADAEKNVSSTSSPGVKRFRVKGA